MTERVLIAGGGPVGAVTALALAQRGFPVVVFEAEPEERDLMRHPPRSPRSSLFSSSLIAWSVLQGCLAFALVVIRSWTLGMDSMRIIG